MSRSDPGAATGQTPVEPKRCPCTHLEPFHKPHETTRVRGACSASTCDCKALNLEET